MIPLLGQARVASINKRRPYTQEKSKQNTKS